MVDSMYAVGLYRQKVPDSCQIILFDSIDDCKQLTSLDDPISVRGVIHGSRINRGERIFPCPACKTYRCRRLS